MSTSADWKAFLAALRADGIAIGAGELLRLQQVFEQAPPLDREGLKQVLACTLLKDRSQRDKFEWLFEQWCPDDADALALAATAEQSESDRPAVAAEPAPRLPQPRLPGAALSPKKPLPDDRLPPETRWFLAVIGVLAVLFLVWLYWRWATTPPPSVMPPIVPATAELPIPPAPAPPPGELPFEPVAAFHLWLPQIDAVLAPGWAESAWLPGFLGLACGLFLYQRYRRRSRLPTPAPTLNEQGKAIDWLPWLALQHSGPELLNAEDLRTLVWGIGRFVSDEPTPTLDIDRTVSATASAGHPELHYRPAIYQREVWLWQDSMTRDPAMERLAAELQRALQRAGLPVRSAWFSDVPEQVVWQQGQVFSTLVLEGHRQSALVAILSDGRGLRLAAESDLDRRPLAQLLAALSDWPHLAFVDISRGRHGLAEALRPYRLACLAPEALPAFLGLGAVAARPRAQRRVEPRLLGELRLWAAALALSPEPVSDDEAYALRRALGLTLPAWALADLRQAADAPGDRLAWPAQQRTELLNWLLQAERHDGELARASLLDKALAFWRARLRRERRLRRDRQSALHAWRETLAEQRLQMERALLLLWKDPRRATAILYSLYSGPLQDEIRARLSTLASCEWRSSKQERDPDRQVVFLPWRESAQTDTTRYLLGEMGFAGHVDRRAANTTGAGRLKPASRLPLAAGLCAGLGSLALGISLAAWLRPAEPVLRSASAAFDHPTFLGLTNRQIEPSGIGEHTLAIGTPRNMVQKTLPSASQVSVDWNWQEHPNREKFGASELWRAGTLPQPIRGCEPDWPRRSLVVIAADPADPADQAARQLAIQLLDRGSADAVLLGTDWQQHYRQKLLQVEPAFARDDQLLIIVPANASASVSPARPEAFAGRYAAVAASDFGKLAQALDFSGTRPLREVWKKPLASVAGDEGKLLLRGGPQEETDPASGVRFVAVCGGSFTMGSASEDASADADEKPAHQVALAPFEIGKYELRFDQYDRFAEATGRAKPDDSGWGRGQRPVVNVSWDDARAFCEHYGHALPSEAQWEYAARAGSTTRWSFGDDEQELGRYAWFAGNAGSKTHPVGEKAANALGVHDMHGNAWEWVADCYDPEAYQRDASGKVTIDPLLTGGSCSLRVLRGGGVWVEARDLRSARRINFEPEVRYVFIGFRCVRGPRRQPP